MKITVAAKLLKDTHWNGALVVDGQFQKAFMGDLIEMFNEAIDRIPSQKLESSILMEITIDPKEPSVGPTTVQ